MSHLPPPPTFAYTSSTESHPVRAGLELGGVLALGFAWYATTSTDIVQRWDVGYDWPTFRRKLTGQAFGADTNHFGTNFIGHPLGGTGYYLSARGNRLTVLQSFAYSVAGSLIWELFGEVSEVVSLNDSLVTPIGGLAIGEATTQLGAFFDRSAPTTANRVLGAAFGPFKTLNDAFDALEPDRARAGFPENEWHHFDFSGLTVVVFEDTSGRRVWPEVRLALSSRLARLAAYEAPGGRGLAFDDANLSSLELAAALGESGLNDLRFAAGVVLAGYHYRERRRGENGELGGNGVVGVGTEFHYSLHDYRRAESDGLDRIAAVTPLGAIFEQRGAIAETEITTRLDAGPDFAGVTPHALSGYGGRRSLLPEVLDRHGYYFALGGHLAAELGVESGPVGASAGFRAESYRSFTGPGERKGARISDLRLRSALELGYRLHGSPAELRAALEHRRRSGRLGEARATNHEFGAGAGFAAVF